MFDLALNYTENLQLHSAQGILIELIKDNKLPVTQSLQDITDLMRGYYKGLNKQTVGKSDG